jgi:hypothetical protein
MAENKKSFVLYTDLLHTFKYLNLEQRGLVITWVLEYVNDMNPEPLEGLLQAVAEPIRLQLKRDLNKYEAKKIQWSEAGKRSAEARKVKKNERTLTDVESRSTDSTVTVNDTVNVNDINNIYNRFVDEVKSGGFDSRIEAMYMRLKIKHGSLTPLLKDFKLHLIEENRNHKNTNDLFLNFKNWLNVQDRIKKLDKYR